MPNSIQLHAWTNGCDYVAAADLEDARRVYRDFSGYDADAALDFEAVPDDRVVRWWLGSDGRVTEHGDLGSQLTEISLGELVQRHGRSYLGSTEH